jgi:tetratricopeptide (TPR) repeat protein
MLFLPVCASAQPSVGTRINEANQATRAGDYPRAEQLLRSTLELLDALEATDDRTATVLNALGQVLRLQRKYEEAESMYLRLLSFYEGRGETNVVEFAETLRQLGLVCERTGRVDEAVQNYQRALAAFETSGASQHRYAGFAHQALGGISVQRGMLESADTAYHRAIEILETASGVRPQVLATTVNNLAVVMQHLGDLDEAQSLFRKAVDIREQEWGPNDPRLATAMANLATLYRRRENYVAADSLYVRAWNIYEAQEDLPVGQILPLLMNIGLNHEQLGRDEDLVTAYERAMELVTDFGVADDQLFAMVAGVLAGHYVRTQKYAEAEPLLLATADAIRRLHGVRHRNLASVLSQYSVLLSNTQRFGEAERVTEYVKEIWGENAATRTRSRRMRVEGMAAERIETLSAEVDAGMYRIYRPDETVDGQRILTAVPQNPTCAEYDSQAGVARLNIEVGPEGSEDAEQVPVRVDATLGVVVGTDGRVVPDLSTVRRTTDFRVTLALLEWAGSCSFTPGAIGAEPVRVRTELPVTFEFVTN